MQCPECQLENVEGAKFCNECGAKLEPVCTNCGNANPPDSKFCNECGHEQDKPVETGPVDYSQPIVYTPKHIAEEILINRSAIEGERKLVTVFFADVANFTSPLEAYKLFRAGEILRFAAGGTQNDRMRSRRGAACCALGRASSTPAAVQRFGQRLVGASPAEGGMIALGRHPAKAGPLHGPRRRSYSRFHSDQGRTRGSPLRIPNHKGTKTENRYQ